MGRTRLASLVLVVAGFVAACGTGSAPEFDDVREACSDTACLGMPSGWSIIDRGVQHVTIEHPDGANATIGFIDMDRVVRSTGDAWPQPDLEVVCDLWALFDGGAAALDRAVERSDGAIESVGESQGHRQWHLLVPLERPLAIGVVVQAPNGSWFRHADAIFDGVRPSS